MKKILLISEQDLAVQRLIELYNSLFINEKKELIHCKIDIIECNQTASVTSTKRRPTEPIVKGPKQLPKLLRLTQNFETIVAQNCKEITDIITKRKISVVILPNFLYDQNRKAQYDIIAKAIKKVSQVDILGLYI